MQVSLNPLRFFLPTALPFFLFFTHLINGPVSAEETTFSPELFAFQTGFANASSKAPEDLVKLVHQAGFDGVELMGLQQVERFGLDRFDFAGEVNQVSLMMRWLGPALDAPDAAAAARLRR